MPEYRRAFEPGGTFFFTVVTHRRRPLFRHAEAVAHLGVAMREVNRDMPFELAAHVILPDHLHCLWTLPDNDTEFSTRWSRIKRLFTKRWLAHGGREGPIPNSRSRHRERGVWQRRFWEHTIRDEDDMVRHLDYIHYSPVKHALAPCPHSWPHSSFARWVENEVYAPDWGCACCGRRPKKPDFSAIDKTAME